MFTGIRYQHASNTLQLLDQRYLPAEETWLACTTVNEVAEAIITMAVRGAPAIATAAAYGLALDAIHNHHNRLWRDYHPSFLANMEQLGATRPTAVNLFNMLEEIGSIGQTIQPDATPTTYAEQLLTFADKVFQADLDCCLAIGRVGAQAIQGSSLRIGTHCNTGSLATSGHGTALGVIRSLHEEGRIAEVFVDETRPWLQGSRLTAFELMKESIPCTLIADHTSAFLMQRQQIDCIIVGADRITSNGDTANKIGTYNLAVAAKHHGVPFYVAAPWATFDLSKSSGVEIAVEERAPTELTEIQKVPVAPKGVRVFNPSFDITPADLITGFITEKGFLQPPFQ